jgi:hypothetical protein
MKNVKQYYQELGKLAYALVLNETEVSGTEVNRLHQFIAKKMHELELIEHQELIHKANTLEFDFVKMDQKKIDPYHALISYKNFIGKNFEENDEALIHKGIHFLATIGDEYNQQKSTGETEVVPPDVGITAANIDY